MFGNGYTPLLLGCQCVVLSQTSHELSQFGVSLSLSLLSVHRSLHSLVVVAAVSPGGRMLLLAPWCYDYVGGSYLSSGSVFCRPCSSGPCKQDFVPSPPCGSHCLPCVCTFYYIGFPAPLSALGGTWVVYLCGILGTRWLLTPPHRDRGICLSLYLSNNRCLPVSQDRRGLLPLLHWPNTFVSQEKRIWGIKCGFVPLSSNDWSPPEFLCH